MNDSLQIGSLLDEAVALADAYARATNEGDAHQAISQRLTRSVIRPLDALFSNADDRGDSDRHAQATARGHASIAIALDRYGHLMPGSDAEARERIEAYAQRAGAAPRAALLYSQPYVSPSPSNP